MQMQLRGGGEGELMALMYSVWLNNSTALYFSISSSIALSDGGVQDPPWALNFPGYCPQMIHTGIVRFC